MIGKEKPHSESIFFGCGFKYLTIRILTENGGIISITPGKDDKQNNAENAVPGGFGFGCY